MLLPVAVPEPVSAKVLLPVVAVAAFCVVATVVLGVAVVAPSVDFADDADEEPRVGTLLSTCAPAQDASRRRGSAVMWRDVFAIISQAGLDLDVHRYSFVITVSRSFLASCRKRDLPVRFFPMSPLLPLVPNV